MILRQSTSVVIPFGPFLDKTDGVTLKTALVSALDNASTGVMISKNGGTLAVRHATVTASVYDAHGCYKLTLDATDTATLGSLRVIYSDATSILPVWQDFQIVTANEWDSQCAAAIRAANVTQLLGTAWLTPAVAGTPDVNAKQLGGTAQTGRDVGASVLLSNGTGTGQLSLTAGLVTLAGVTHTGARIPNVTLTDTVTTLTNKTGFALAVTPPTVAQIVNGVWDESLNAHTVAGTAGKVLGTDIWTTPLTGYAAGQAGKIINDNLDATVSSRSTVATIWDRQLTAATHNILNSAGRLQRVAAGTITGGQAQSGGAHFIQLASSESSIDHTYDPGVVQILSGTGSGQSRLIIQYVGSSRTAYVDRDWRVAPDSSSIYEIVSAYNVISTQEGIAQGGSATTITLNSLAAAANDSYVGQTVVLRSSTGQDQSRMVIAYNGSTKVATINQAWQTNPVAGTGYIMWPLGRPTATEITNAVWDEQTSLHQGAGTMGKALTSAGASGDPWTAPLPGSYAVGSAGKIIGDNINATVASRSTYAGTDTPGTTTLLSRVPGTVQPQTGDSFARLGAPANASVSADIAVVAANDATLLTRIPGVVQPQTGDSFARIGANGAGLTAVTAVTVTDKAGYSLAVPPPTTVQIRTEIDANSTKLDVPVSSRSTYNGTDTPGTTTLLSRLTPVRAANLDDLDAPISSIPAAVWQETVRTLTAFGFPVVASNVPTASEVAIEVLVHDWSTISTEAGRSMLNALRSLRNKVAITDNGDGTGTITVTKENDSSPAWTAICTFNNNAHPISGVDPV